MQRQFIRIAIGLFCFGSVLLADRILIEGRVTSIVNGAPGIRLGDPIYVIAEYEIVTTPHESWDPSYETLWEGVLRQATVRAMGECGEINWCVGEIPNYPSIAFWAIQSYYFVTPLFTIDRGGSDYIFLFFADDLQWTGMLSGNGWYEVYLDPALGVNEWWMGNARFRDERDILGSITYAISIPSEDDPAPTPEPSTFALAAGALLALGILRRRSA